MVPTRNQIADKIDEIKTDPNFSTIQSEIVAKIDTWLDEEECPAVDKEKILGDLQSYPNY